MKPKPLFYIFVSAIILLTLSFCKNQKDDSNNPLNVLLRLLVRDATSNLLYNIEGMPSQVNVVMPRSIRKTDTSTTVSGSIRNFLRAPSQPHAEGLSSLQDTTEKVEALLFDTIHDFILLSNMNDTVKSDPGKCYPGGHKTITITQNMMNTIQSYLVKFGKTEAEALALIEEKQNSGELPTVGAKVPVPSIVYNNNQNGYDHEYLYSFGQSLLSQAKCPEDITNKKSFDKILRFNGDLTKSFLSIKKTYSFLGLEIVSVATILHESVGDNLNHRNVLTLKTTQEESGRKTSKVFRAKLEECNKTSTDEACLKVDTITETRLPNFQGGSSSNSFDLKVEVNGISDNNGGFLIVTRYLPDPTGSKKSIKKCFKEVFESDGTIKGFSESNDCKTYTTPYSDLSIDYNDSFIAGYVEESLSFSGIVYVTLNSLTSVTEDDYYTFVIVKDGVDPSSVDNPYDYIIGYGSYYDSSGDGSAQKNEVFIDYFGTESEISTSKIYREDWNWSDSAQEYTSSYTLLSNTIVKDNNPSVAMTDPFASATVDSFTDITLTACPSNQLLNDGYGSFMVYKGGSDPNDYNNYIGDGYWDTSLNTMSYTYFYGDSSEIASADLYIYDYSGNLTLISDKIQAGSSHPTGCSGGSGGGPVNVEFANNPPFVGDGECLVIVSAGADPYNLSNHLGDGYWTDVNFDTLWDSSELFINYNGTADDINITGVDIYADNLCDQTSYAFRTETLVVVP